MLSSEPQCEARKPKDRTQLEVRGLAGSIARVARRLVDDRSAYCNAVISWDCQRGCGDEKESE